jgi:hypothetical protein
VGPGIVRAVTGAGVGAGVGAVAAPQGKRSRGALIGAGVGSGAATFGKTGFKTLSSLAGGR